MKVLNKIQLLTRSVFRKKGISYTASNTLESLTERLEGKVVLELGSINRAGLVTAVRQQPKYHAEAYVQWYSLSKTKPPDPSWINVYRLVEFRPALEYLKQDLVYLENLYKLANSANEP